VELAFFTQLFRGLRPDEYVVLKALAGGTATHYYLKTPEEIGATVERLCSSGVNLYFGVCPRNERAATKEAVSRALCVWLDLDVKDHQEGKKELLEHIRAAYILPPTAIVDSGNGYHVYWRLRSSTTRGVAEALAKSMSTHLNGDQAATDSSRFLRVPGTTNWKDPENPLPVVLVTLQGERQYTPDDLKAGFNVPASLIERIHTGSTKGYESRSERDWAVIRALTRAGIKDDDVFAMFSENPIGDKLRDPSPQGGETYFARTLERATMSAQVPATFTEVHDCYYLPDREKQRQVSTFVYTPARLLEGPGGDILSGTMKASGYTWPDVALSRAAFAGSSALIRELPYAAWQWLGSDREAKMLLPHLMQQLLDAGLPRAVATHTLGRHEDYFVTADSVLTADGVLSPAEAPYQYVPTGREAPELTLTFPSADAYRALLRGIAELLPKVNVPHVVFPVFSWFMTAPYKTVLKERHATRFPVLNVYGTRGAGKTSLLLEIMQPLLGCTPQSYSCATTPFVLLSLLASTNCIPIAFSEFRSTSLSEQTYSKLMRYILLAYDVGRDARGRPDQTTTVYPLDAPFSIDGEDALGEPAAIERSIIVNLAPENIVQGSEAFDAFQKITRLPLRDFAGHYLQHTLTFDTQLALEEAHAIVRGALDRPLPDRVYNNLVVCVVGYISALQHFAKWGVALPDIDVEAFRSWFGAPTQDAVAIERGRTSMHVDEFVTDVINAVASTGTTEVFMFKYKREQNELWFHTATAIKWWFAKRRREGLQAIGELAVKRQLRERTIGESPSPGQYLTGSTTQNVGGKSVHMWGISVQAAYDCGLDVPQQLDVQQITLNITS